MPPALLCILLLPLSWHTAYSQGLDSIPDELPEFETYDTFSLSPLLNCAAQASQDIEAGDPRLIICYNRREGGEYPAAFYSTQQEFEAQYGITYKLYTCTPDNEPCIKKYNKRVAKHLTKSFGRTWKKEVRTDVYGIR